MTIIIMVATTKESSLGVLKLNAREKTFPSTGAAHSGADQSKSAK
jgi:hypothetical protein